jgi:hypothetical protein
MRREFHVRFCEGPRVRFPRATRLVIGFEREDDAKRVMSVLGQRFERYGLHLHPDKTRLLPFGRPTQDDRKGTATFDLLGFTLYWRRTRGGRWMPGFKTRTARLRRAITAVADWCRSHRHESVKEQHAALTRRVQGHINYFGVNGNLRSLRLTRPPGGTGLAQMAKSTWPAEAAELGAIRGPVAASAAGQASDSRPSLHVSLSLPRRRRRMVEISLSGSGEGPGAE